jgi:hypothetical protein
LPDDHLLPDAKLSTGDEIRDQTGGQRTIWMATVSVVVGMANRSSAQTVPRVEIWNLYTWCDLPHIYVGGQQRGS